MTKERNSNIELLRLLLMAGILVWHLIIHGVGLKNLGTADYVTDDNTLPLLMVCGLLAPATYCFVFITGYHGLNVTVKKVCYLVFVCFVVRQLTGVLNCVLWHAPFKIDQSVFFPLATGKWWFMTNYLELMLLSPFINKGIAALDRHSYLMLLMMLISYNTLTLVKASPNLGSNLLGLTNVYLLASYMRKYNVKLKRKSSWIILLVSAAVLTSMVAMVYLLVPSHKNLALALLSYNNPLIMAMAAAVFFIARGFKPHYSRVINTCCQPALFVYLISEGFRPHIYHQLILPPPIKG